MCPYARFQSVMVDRDTYVVTYDTQRGEPRGSRSRNADFAAQGLGSCVDCSICVQVCPTGIDIRQGLQYECIGCGACIDACDQVMDKMRYPRGLIRYTSERAMRDRLNPKEARRHLLRPRVLIYVGIMLVLTTGFVVALAMRQPLKVDVIRDRGALAREVDGGKIENVYRLQLMNASEQPMRVTITAEGLPALDVQGGRGESTSFELAPAANRLVPIRVRRPADDVQPGSHKIRFVIQADKEGSSLVLREPSSFIVPR
jgi:cytochrome c oxidase accessory protein FixG